MTGHTGSVVRRGIGSHRFDQDALFRLVVTSTTTPGELTEVNDVHAARGRRETNRNICCEGMKSGRSGTHSFIDR